MKRILILLALMTTYSYGSGGGEIALEHANVNIHDQASLQRGAKLFANYCMGCHSAQFQRYERTANDLGIPNDLFEKYLVFGNAKIGDLMTISMSKTDGKSWFGAPPPDLTLTARLRGPDWLYTYLKSFYIDNSRPWGVNNKVFKNVGMPHVLMELQGEQRMVCKRVAALHDGEKQIDPHSGKPLEDTDCEFLDLTENTGKLTKEQYDAAILDLVNFLTYLGEPFRLESNRIGIYVILFLIVLLVFAYLLKREYWKDVH